MQNENENQNLNSNPDAPPPAAQPSEIVQPAQPSGPQTVQPAAGPAPSPAAQQVAGSKRKALALIIIGTLLLVAAVAALLFFVVFKNQISATDVQSAQNTASSMAGNVSAISSDLVSENNPSTSSALNTELNADQNKLTNAEKEFSQLQKSKVLKDQKTDQAFSALAAKWGPYDTYVKNDLSDIRAMFPPIFQLMDSAQKLENSSPTTVAQLSTFLASFKNSLDTASSQLASVHVVLPENQQGLNAINSFLSSASADIAAAQKDVTAGNYAGAVSDLDKLDTSETTMGKTLESVDTKSNNHEESLDPSKALDNFQTALDNLQTQISGK